MPLIAHKKISLSLSDAFKSLQLSCANKISDHSSLSLKKVKPRIFEVKQWTSVNNLDTVP